MIYETAEALTYCGNRAMEQGNDALARGLYEEGLAIWRAVDFQPGIAHLLERLERLAHRQKERTDDAPTGRRRGHAGALRARRSP
jgi:hypothetical protein